MEVLKPIAPDLIAFHSIPRVVRRRRGARARVLVLRLVLVPLILLGVYCALGVAALVSWSIAGTDYDARVDELPPRAISASRVLQYNYVANGIAHHGSAVINGADMRLIAASNPPTLRIRAIGLGPWYHDAVLRRDQSPWEVSLPAIFTCLMGVLLGMGSYFFAFIVPAQRRQLYETGTAAHGRILRKIQRVQGKTLALSLTYEFSPSTGPDRAGVLSVWRRTYARASEGEAVVILYDPGNPELNVVYEYGDYELA